MGRGPHLGHQHIHAYAIESTLRDGYSQEGFADLVGVHRTYMGAVERGEVNISLRNMEKIAGSLEITASKLLREAEKEP